MLVVLRTIQYNMTKMRVSTERRKGVNATTAKKNKTKKKKTKKKTKKKKKKKKNLYFHISLYLFSVTVGVRTIVSSIC